MTDAMVGKVGDGERMALIAICNLDVITNKPYATHLQFAYKLAKDNPDFQFILFTPYRMTIANFRNMAAKAALEINAEYIMFIDDDAVLVNHSSIFKELLDKIDDDENKHIVMPVVYVRGYPFNPMFFKFETDPEIIKEGKGIGFYKDWKEQETDDKGLLELAAIGCHTCLIKTEVFNAIEQPYFLTGLSHTEDVYFCMKCRDYIDNIGIYLATDISIAHLVDPLYVDDNNVEIMREFYEKLGLDTSLGIVQSIEQPNKIESDLKNMGEDFTK